MSEEIEIDPRLVDALSRLGFEGLDCNLEICMREYGGVWCPEHEVALLFEVDKLGPRVCLQRISKADIRYEVGLAGPSFHKFTDDSLPLTEGMHAIQSLMLWNGGWHQNSQHWNKLSETDIDNLIRRIKEMCEQPR